MLQASQILSTLALLVKLLLSVNLALGIALFGAIVHSEAPQAACGQHVDSTHLAFKSSYTVLIDTWEDGEERRAQAIHQYLPSFIYKFHFVFALGMFAVIGAMVVADSVAERALLLLPIVLFYGISHILFAADQAEMLRDMMARYKRRLKARA